MTHTLVNWLLAIAGIGCVTAAVVHSTVGERLFVQPILARMDWSGFRSEMFARRIVRLAWHVTSVTWLGFAVILLAPILGVKGPVTAYWAAAATFGTAFLMTGYGTDWKHRGWPVFAIVTAALIGALVLGR